MGRIEDPLDLALKLRYARRLVQLSTDALTFELAVPAGEVQRLVHAYNVLTQAIDYLEVH